MQESVRSFRDQNPSCVHRLWSDQEINNFVAEEFTELLPAELWRQLEPIQRADLFRYAVVYRMGGFYADIDVSCLKPFDEWGLLPDTRLVAGYESGWHLDEETRKAVSFSRSEQFEQWTFGAAPGHAVLRRCLELFRERLEWDFETTVELTGPAVFSDATKEFLRSESRSLGLRVDPPAPESATRWFLLVRGGHAYKEAEHAALRFPPPGLPGAGVLLLSAEQVAVPGFSAPGFLTNRSLIRHGFKGVWKSSPNFFAKFEWPSGIWPDCSVLDLALHTGNDSSLLFADVAAVFGAAAAALTDCSDLACTSTERFALECQDDTQVCHDMLESACAYTCSALQVQGCRFWTTGPGEDILHIDRACWLLSQDNPVQLLADFRSGPVACMPPRAPKFEIPWDRWALVPGAVPRVVHRGCDQDMRVGLALVEVALFQDAISLQGYVSFRKHMPDAVQLLWTAADFHECVDREFPAHVSAYESLQASGQHAEAGRYCALHRFGGIYADLDYEALHDFHSERFTSANSTAYVVASPYRSNETVQSALLAGPPGHSLWRLAFEAIMSTSRQSAGASRPSGTTLLTKLVNDLAGDKRMEDRVEVLSCRIFDRPLHNEAFARGECLPLLQVPADAADPTLAGVHWSSWSGRGNAQSRSSKPSPRQMEVLRAFEAFHADKKGSWKDS